MPDPCPWDGLAPGTVSFCEARLCAWVAEPANAWSSLAYVAAALWMARAPARSGGWTVIVAQLAIGVGSFFFHSSGTFVGELVDQAGMYLLSALLLVEALAGPRGWSEARRTGTYAALVGASTLLNLVVRPIGIPLFALQLAAGLALQVRLGLATREPRYRLFAVALGTFALSFGIWALDISRVLCDPDRHWLSGHAVWHGLNAICVERLGRFYGLGRAQHQQSQL